MGDSGCELQVRKNLHAIEILFEEEARTWWDLVVECKSEGCAFL